MIVVEPLMQRAVDDVRMADHPADVAGREHRLAGLDAEDVAHRRGQRHGVAAGIALHALWACRSCPTCRGCTTARSIRAMRTAPARPGDARAAPRSRGRGRRRAASCRSRPRSTITHLAPADAWPAAWRSSTRCLYGTALPPRMPASAVTMHLRRGIVDARGEARRGEAAEHDRMDRADAHAGEHREHGLRHHRHVDQHAVAALHAETRQHRGAAVHLGVELAIRVACRSGPSRSRGRPAPPVRRARRGGGRRALWHEVGAAADEPARERRPRVVEHRRERRLPVDRARPSRARTPRGPSERDGIPGSVMPPLFAGAMLVADAAPRAVSRRACRARCAPRCGPAPGP